MSCFLCCTTHRIRQAGLTNWMSPQLCRLQDEKTKSPLFSGARSYKWLMHKHKTKAKLFFFTTSMHNALFICNHGQPAPWNSGGFDFCPADPYWRHLTAVLFPCSLECFHRTAIFAYIINFLVFSRHYGENKKKHTTTTEKQQQKTNKHKHLLINHRIWKP